MHTNKTRNLRAHRESLRVFIRLATSRILIYADMHLHPYIILLLRMISSRVFIVEINIVEENQINIVSRKKC